MCVCAYKCVCVLAYMCESDSESLHKCTIYIHISGHMFSIPPTSTHLVEEVLHQRGGALVVVLAVQQ